jgi:hypothetical protein
MFFRESVSLLRINSTAAKDRRNHFLHDGRNLPSVRPGRDGSPQYRAAAIFSLAKPFAARYAKK